MKKSSIKAFTLIELLVVVAIIGILAAIGVVSFSGFTGGAKVSAAKANHANVVKSLSAELKKCEMGTQNLSLMVSSTTPTNVACSKSSTNTATMVTNFIGHFNNSGFKNPYTQGLALSNTATTEGTTRIVANTPTAGQITITTYWIDETTNAVTTSPLVSTITDER
jgi:type IV pilus assembly protein PilA